MRVLTMLLILCLLTGCAGIIPSPTPPKPADDTVEIIKTLYNSGCDVVRFAQSKRAQSLEIECE